MARVAAAGHEDAHSDLDAPSPSRLTRRRASFASSSSSESTSLSDAANDHFSDSGSDEEEGVFFGTHQPKEAALVAQLSSTISTPTRPLVRKRDSREFLRRKTLLLSARKANTPAPSTARKEDTEKEWSGGFYVKGARPRAVEADVDSDDEFTTPRITFHDPGSPVVAEDDHCDLTFDFGNFRLHDAASPLVCRPTIATLDRRESPESSEVESESEEDESYADSDKENNEALVSPVSVRSDRMPLEERAEFLVALSKGIELFEAEPEGEPDPIVSE